MINNTIKVLSEIELYEIEDGRKTAFKSSYRPLFNFAGASTKISGQIILIDKDLFYPGDSGLVEIHFLPEYFNPDWIAEKREFTFDEGRTPLGEGKILGEVVTSAPK